MLSISMRTWMLLYCLSGAAAAVSAQTTAASATTIAPSPAPKYAKPAFVGSATCAACHEDIAKAFASNPHQATEKSDKHGFSGKACESCHGPGGKHVESVSAADIRNPSKLAAADTDKTCLTCHQNRPTSVGRIENSHANNQVACTGCHSIHANGSQGLVVRKTPQINTLCAGCHETVMASFQLPFKHRVPEGAMSCVDCHNPHGSLRPGLMQLSSANEPGCFRCHSDKRGPFTFEHEPVRAEGCQACHVPHGSANAKMLIRQEVRFVCLECHANLPALPGAAQRVAGVVPPAFHDLNSPRFRNCTICHQKIHGSHADRNLLR